MSNGLDDYSFCIYLSIHEKPSENAQKDEYAETLEFLRQRKQELLKRIRK